MPTWAHAQLFIHETASDVRGALRTALPGRAALVVVFASPSRPLGEITAALAPDHDTVIGCTSAGEFVGRHEAKGAVSVFAVGGDLVATAGLGRGLRDDPSAAVERALAGQPTEVPGMPHRTGIVLLDPLSGVGEEAALLVAEALGDVPLAGGAAGDDLQMKETIVAFGDAHASDGLVVAQVFSRERLGLGVRHGHTPISRPLTVTAAEGAVVETLDGEPAWEVWKRETREAARALGVDVDALEGDAVGAFLLRFEAGLSTLDETKVRAPLTKGADGSITFATALPVGSVIRITESSPDSQVESAHAAARAARAALEGRPVAGALVFDCICRNLILGDRFGAAVAGMADALDGAPLAGFETYGEVALHDGALSGFHNTTSVVLAFPRDAG